MVEKPKTFELSFRCENLKDADKFSKSDPAALVLTRIEPSKEYKVLGKTETINNNLNPNFSRRFTFLYLFQQKQIILIKLFDIDNENEDINKQDFLGEYEFSLGELVTRKMIKANIKNGTGSIILNLLDISDSKETVELQFRGVGLKDMDIIGKSDPYLEIYYQSKATPNSSPELVYRTEVIDNNLNPLWQPFRLPVSRLFKGNNADILKVVCMDSDSIGSDDLIGSFETTYEEIKSAKKRNFQLVDPKKGSKTGQIIVEKFISEVQHTFIDYISAGTQLHFTVAVDLSGSNKPHSDVASLHHCQLADPNSASMYEKVIRVVTNVCKDYDFDKRFAALGFGAKLAGNAASVSQCFPLSLQAAQPHCNGVLGVVAAYRHALASVQPAEPTSLVEVIDHVAGQAAKKSDGSQYHVLIVFTDGQISNQEETVSTLIAASRLPMSVIIVGLGDGDFTDMKLLDSDEELLTSGRMSATRDMVQFVPLTSQSLSDEAAVSRQVLGELPGQLEKWMHKRNLVPLKRVDPPPPAAPEVDETLPLPAGFYSDQQLSGIYKLTPNVGKEQPPGFCVPD